MLLVSGTVLVLFTWGAALVILAAIGTPLATLLHRAPVNAGDLRRGLWWGLLTVAVAAYLINLAFPLGSALSIGTLGALAVGGLVVTFGILRQRGWDLRTHWGGAASLIAVMTAVVAIYLAVSALGPVTNYDTGLYHLGAIAYAAEFQTVPGLANLFFPLGYGNAEFPLAALLNSSPWGADGFRLLNGLIVVVLCLDLVLRALTRRDAGFFVLLAGAPVVLVPMLALSDYWVTSPSQDSAVFVVTVAATGLLSNAVAGQREWLQEAATAAAASFLVVLLRPTMVVFALAVLVVLGILGTRRRKSDSPGWLASIVTVGVVGTLAAVAASLRDYVLSGWLQYPLSLVKFDVPWAASDPEGERLATLGYHRDPSNLWEAAGGWGWIRPWVEGLARQWELWLIILLTLISGLTFLLAFRASTSIRWRGLALTLGPSVVMSLFWWTMTPPSFRFAWGPIFTIFTVMIGWVAWRMSGVDPATPCRWALKVTAIAALPVVGVAAYSALTRLDTESIQERRLWTLGVQVPYVVAPVQPVPTKAVTTEGGLVLHVPVDSEQCWSVFPLCTPRPSPSLRLDGTYLSDGLLP